LRLRLVFRRDACLSRRLLALAFAEFSDAIFARGVFRRGTYRFFLRVVESGGAFCAFPVGCRAVIGVLVQRNRFVGFSQPASINTAVTARATGVRWRALQLLRNEA
jgi:hypothetical protein